MIGSVSSSVGYQPFTPVAKTNGQHPASGVVPETPEETQTATTAQDPPVNEPTNAAANANEGTSQAPHTEDNAELSKEDQQKINELKKRDQEVKAHEQAHIAAGGAYVQGGAQLTYEKGPDGRRYAVGGEVSISTSKARTPEETITKAQVIRRAALAPADPSPQDRRVAAQASAMETSARRELSEAQREENAPLGENPETKGQPAASNGIETITAKAREWQADYAYTKKALDPSKNTDLGALVDSYRDTPSNASKAHGLNPINADSFTPPPFGGRATLDLRL